MLKDKATPLARPRLKIHKPTLTKVIFALVSVFCGSLAQAGLQISHVNHTPQRFLPQKGEHVKVQYTLSESARVTLNIYDGRDLLIRTIQRKEDQAKGNNAIIWDGKDQFGEPVPPEVYHYTLSAISAKGEQVEYDLTDYSGGKPVKVHNIKWNEQKKIISYVLTDPARINIRIGLKNHGPLLRSVFNWVPRQAGENEEHWDGMDASNILDISRHPNKQININAYQISNNSIFVGEKSTKVTLISGLRSKPDWPTKKRIKKKKHRKRMYRHSQQPIETRRDIVLKLSLPPGLERNKDGIPIVSGKVPILLNVAKEDRVMVLNRRSEPVFFLDGQFVFENEVGYLPMTWKMDTANINEGLHYVTANLLGYEGNFGIATIQFIVKK